MTRQGLFGTEYRDSGPEPTLCLFHMLRILLKLFLKGSLVSGRFNMK